MKKIVLCVLTVLLYSNLFSFDWYKELQLNFIDEESLRLGNSYENYGYRCQRQNSKLLIFDTRKFDYTQYPYVYLDKPQYVSIQDFVLEKSGFLRFSYNGQIYQIILGNEYFAIFGNKNDLHLFAGKVPYWKEKRKSWDSIYDLVFLGNRNLNFPPESIPFSWIVKKVTQSSFLTEQTDGIVFKYSGANIENYLIATMFGGTEVNITCFPWVENVAGGGIGEWIELELDSPQNMMYVLNGFVDGTRPHLYKMNSRMQTALVEGTTADGKKISQTVYFEDFVYFRTIVFAEPVERVRITIQSVYEGAKWQDTAISAIMFPAGEWEKSEDKISWKPNWTEERLRNW